MRAISVTLSMAAVIWTGSLVLAQNDKGWIGTTFHPDRCLRIQAGEFEVQRKLCRIKYDIKLQNKIFTIDGRLDFNKKFVPTQPKRVELELLFIDDRFVCRRQINLDKPVINLPVTFSVEAPTTTTPQYIRTYYTLYYQ